MKVLCLKGVVALLTVLCAGSALADPIYRWVDANGVINYGTTPPPPSARLTAPRAIDLSDSLATHESAAQLANRLAREKAAAAEFDAAREERLRLELLEQRIATERAKGNLLTAQANSLGEGRRGDCDGMDEDCAVPVVFIGSRPRHLPHRLDTPVHEPLFSPAPVVTNVPRAASVRHVS